MNKNLKLTNVQTAVLEELLLSEIALNKSRMEFYTNKKDQVRKQYNKLNLPIEAIDSRIQEDYDYFERVVEKASKYLQKHGRDLDIFMADYLIETLETKQSWNDELLRNYKGEESFAATMFLLMQNRMYFEIRECIYDTGVTKHLADAKFQHELEI